MIILIVVQEELASSVEESSTTNLRIECHWHDVFVGCTILFYKLLYYNYEEIGILHSDDAYEIHLFSLHYIFLKHINHRVLLNSTQLEQPPY